MKVKPCYLHGAVHSNHIDRLCQRQSNLSSPDFCPLPVYSSPVGLLLLLHVASIPVCPTQLWLISILLPSSADSVLGQLQHRSVWLQTLYLSVIPDWNLKDLLKWWLFETAPSSKLSLSLLLSGLISPGVSVPVQVPGTEQQGMSHNLGQYWARLQWTTDNQCQAATLKRSRRGEGRVTKRCEEYYLGVHTGFKEAQDWSLRGASEGCRPQNASHVYKISQEQLKLHLRVLWSYWYLLSTIRLLLFGGELMEGSF